jgi:hypothetical protein
MRLKKETKQAKRRRGWWQVTSINPAWPEGGRRVHYKRLLESTAISRAERLNKYDPRWEAIAEPMPTTPTDGNKK